MSYDTKENDLNVGTATDIVILDLFIYTSLETKVYQRKYQKIQEAFANIGGFINFLMCVGWMTISIPLHFTFNRVIMNEIYSFQPSRKKKKKRLSNLEKETEIKEIKKLTKITQNLNLEHKVDEIPLETAKKDEPEIQMYEKKSSDNKVIIQKILPKTLDIHNDSDHFENFSREEIEMTSAHPLKIMESQSQSRNSKVLESQTIKSKISLFFSAGKKISDDKFEEFKIGMNEKFHLSINFFNFLSMKFKTFFKFKVRDTEELYEISEKKLEKELDIIRVLNKLKEIDILKYVLLNERQLFMFNLIGKPMIFLKQKEVDTETKESPGFKLGRQLEENEMMNEKKFLQFKQFYSMKINNQEGIPEIEKRLLELTKHSIDTFYENFI